MTAEESQANVRRLAREAEERVQRCAELGRIVLYDVDVASGRMFAHGVAELVGTPPTVLSSAWWHERMHPGDLPAHHAGLQDHLRTGGVRRTTYRVRHADGRWLTVEDSREVILGPDGRAARILGTVVDQTARVVAEAEMRARTALLRAIADRSADLIYAKDRDGRLLFANPSLGRLLGRPPQSLVGKAEDEYLGEGEAADAIRRNDQRIMASGIDEVVEEVVPTDGGVRVFVSTKAPLRDESGAVVGLVGISHDITDRKEIERSLELAAARAEVAQAAARASLYEYAPITGAVVRNPTIVSLVGYSPLELESTKFAWRALIHPDDVARFDETLHRAVAFGEDYALQYRVRHRDGHDVWILDQARVSRDAHGAVDRIIGMVVDISERHAVEEELRRVLRHNEMFIGVLGHDLRNPLAAILGSAEAALPKATQPSLKRGLERIVRSGYRMVRMIEQLLDVTRIRSAGGLAIDRAEVDLAALCRNVADELRDANPALALELDVTGNPRGAWDVDRLSQVVSNLLGNAAEYGAPDGRVVAEVDGSRDEVVSVRIHNQGAIPGEILPELFEPFRRAENISRKARGLGLGLYISREIVRAHGGSIRVSSTQSGGTTFEIALPRWNEPHRLPSAFTSA